MFVQYCFYSYMLFIMFSDEFSDANPIGGKNVQLAGKDEFPFVVSLMANASNFVEKENHLCGGALISHRHVLTAAHCVQQFEFSDVSVIAGTIDFQSGQMYTVESWITYDEWAEKNLIPRYTDNDIAIITLLLDVKDIVPGVISKLKRDEVIEKDVVIAGWGFIDEYMDWRPKSLQKAYSKVLNYEKLPQSFMKLLDVMEPAPLNLYFTSVNPPVVITCGDSGSPLLLASNNEIVGVVVSSYRAGCTFGELHKVPNFMTINVAVDYYRGFVESVMMSNATS